MAATGRAGLARSLLHFPGMVNATLFQRLTLGYLAILFLVLALGFYVTLQLNRINRLAVEASTVYGDAARQAESLEDSLGSLAALEQKFHIARDRDFYLRFVDSQEAFQGKLAALVHLVRDTPLQALVLEAQRLERAYAAQVDARAERMPPQDSAEPPPESGEVQVESLVERLHAVVLAAEAGRDAKIRAAGQISGRVFDMTATAALVCVSLGLLISWTNTRSVNRSIRLLQAQMQALAKGRFQAIGRIAAPPEIQALAEDFNRMGTRLQELDELKEDFIRHVSHDLRTPLTVIKEASGLLREGAVAGSAHQQDELLSIIRSECDRLIASVNRILDLSRMEANMMAYRIAPVDPMAIARQVVLKLAPLAMARRIDLALEPATLPLVRADQEQLSQLLENLLGNALKFTPAGGAVRVCAAAPEAPGDPVQMAVRDTGTGIAMEDLEKIFEKFRRIETGGPTARGTGLGLTIAKHIVTAHGGKIWAESRPGAGSTFCFTLPRA
jgi:two-component system sensor histidine kinase GlrK